jgi:hypothetical protein
MKIMLLLAILFLSQATAVRETITARIGCEKIQLKDNVLLIHSQAENKEHTFILNTGMQTSIVFEESINGNERKPDVEWSVDNHLFAGQKRFKINPKHAFSCNAPAATVSGHYGYDFFRKSNTAYLFNFDEQTLCSLNRESVENLLKKGYSEIRSNFSQDGISIFVNMKWKPYEFIFDTGYPGAFSLAYNDNIAFVKEIHQTLETGRDSADFIYNNRFISVNGINYSASVVIAKPAKKAKMGMAFIKGFNWIIDFRKKKVYILKNAMGLDTQSIYLHDYNVVSKAGKLLIASRNIKSTKFKLGDTITAVNDKKVTPGNICEIENLLAKTADWQALKIETAQNE